MSGPVLAKTCASDDYVMQFHVPLAEGGSPSLTVTKIGSSVYKLNCTPDASFCSGPRTTVQERSSFSRTRLDVEIVRAFQFEPISSRLRVQPMIIYVAQDGALLPYGPRMLDTYELTCNSDDG